MRDLEIAGDEYEDASSGLCAVDRFHRMDDALERQFDELLHDISGTAEGRSLERQNGRALLTHETQRAEGGESRCVSCQSVLAASVDCVSQSVRPSRLCFACVCVRIGVRVVTCPCRRWYNNAE